MQQILCINNTMTSKVEKSPGLGLSYGWTITGINHEEPQLYTKKFMCKKTEILRVGIKTAGKNHSSSNPAIVFLLTTNLQMMGLKVLSVVFFKREYGNTEGNPWSRIKQIGMEHNDLTTENEEAAGTQLFTSHLKLDEIDLSPTEFEFVFMIYLTGIVDKYRVQQFDGLKNQQLWSSIKDERDRDFKLIASDGKSLQVHKWVLAARSPFFAALFSREEEIKSINLPVDCTFRRMKQFIYFLYTGELAGRVSHELMKLSEEYQIKTLEDICQSAFQDVYDLSDDKMAMISCQLDSGSHLICNELNEPDEEWYQKHFFDLFVSIFTCTWSVQNLSPKENEKSIKMSVPFEHEGKKLFRANLVMKKSPSHPEKYTLTALKFLSYGHESLCYRIYQVGCSIDDPDQNSCSHQQIMMTWMEVPEDKKTSLQVFTCLLPTELATPISCPFVITFHAKLRNTVTIYKPLDSTCSGELWTAAVNRKMTDVEFLVGEEAFGAHRSLLSARSPVFAAMFASGMKEAETGRVLIDDVDPSTFERFLKFLYTGMLESLLRDEKLFAVADKYGCEILTELCRRANTTTGDTDYSLLQTFMAC